MTKQDNTSGLGENNVSQHALKSVACFLAVTFFSTSQMCVGDCLFGTTVMGGLYYLSVISKPLFFMMIGYMDTMKGLTRAGARVKFGYILLIVAFWGGVSLFFDSKYIHMGYALQNGMLLSLMAVYVAYPAILKGRQRGWVTLCVLGALVLGVGVLDSLHGLDVRDDPLLVSSHAFFWVWAGYYMVGCFLASDAGRLLTKRTGIARLGRLMMIPAGVSLYFYEHTLSNRVPSNIALWFVLEHLHLLAVCFLLFVLFDNITINIPWVRQVVTFVSPTMIGVYLSHYSIFYIMIELTPLAHGAVNLFLLVGVFMVSVLFCHVLLMNKVTARIVSF